MLDILKKTYLAGAGLAAKTWDEVESVSKEIVKKAKMSEKEGAKYLKDMKKRYDETQKKTGIYVEKIVNDMLKKMDIATADDVKALKKEIRQLKKASGLTGTPKRTTAAAKKRTTAAAKKRTTAAAKKRTTAAAKKRTTAAAKKRTTTAAKKRTTTAAKKRVATKSVKKTTGRASTTKRAGRAGSK